ncbi:hypothetical protein JRQ81_010549 [Phrynocephalus forsythii]|uniref:Uncharacterized protein n=1 Tax=Phrynocephalus forsythii TaxID=171643 RepID=A0A9Q0Y0U4_9SAUR|nr:hypothetical protein JRQ81_010549 [Phrynocephalus forsythii]
MWRPGSGPCLGRFGVVVVVVVVGNVGDLAEKETGGNRGRAFEGEHGKRGGLAAALLTWRIPVEGPGWRLPRKWGKLSDRVYNYPEGLGEVLYREQFDFNAEPPWEPS